MPQQPHLHIIATVVGISSTRARARARAPQISITSKNSPVTRDIVIVPLAAITLITRCIRAHGRLASESAARHSRDSRD